MTEAVATHRGEMFIQDKTGDTKLVWDANKPDERENAERTFKDLKSKGYMAYKVVGKGDKGEQMRDFDPYAEKVIMALPLQGG